MSEAKGRVYLFNSRIPPEIPALLKSCKQVDLISFMSLVKAAAVMVATNNPTPKLFKSLTVNVDKKWIAQSYPGILLIIQRALRVPDSLLKKKDFIADLEDLNIPDKFQEAFCGVLFPHRPEMHPGSECLLPTVEDFRWRIDVAISTTALNRVMEPSILVDIKTDKNEEHVFEVSKEKFHELRYAVSEVLSHMQQLEKRSVLKIET